jgi:hypothetical protein
MNFLLAFSSRPRVYSVFPQRRRHFTKQKKGDIVLVDIKRELRSTAHKKIIPMKEAEKPETEIKEKQGNNTTVGEKENALLTLGAHTKRYQAQLASMLKLVRLLWYALSPIRWKQRFYLGNQEKRFESFFSSSINGYLVGQGNGNKEVIGSLAAKGSLLCSGAQVVEMGHAILPVSGSCRTRKNYGCIQG